MIATYTPTKAVPTGQEKFGGKNYDETDECFEIFGS